MANWQWRDPRLGPVGETVADYYAQEAILAKVGDAGDTVRKIQQALVNRGFSVGSSGVDGKFGPATETAVKMFQFTAGLGVSGQVDQKTYDLLTSAMSVGTPSGQGTATGSDAAPPQPSTGWPWWKSALVIGGGVLVFGVVLGAMKKRALGDPADAAIDLNPRPKRGKCRFGPPAASELEDAELL